MAHLLHPYVIAIIVAWWCKAAEREKDVSLFASTSIREISKSGVPPTSGIVILSLGLSFICTVQDAVMSVGLSTGILVKQLAICQRLWTNALVR